jgi:His/Glu/Gln/Arg/opine family amino acid ABC transporter permease subunit
MTTISDPRSGGLTPVVNYDEPPVKPPPLLAVGPLAWIRKNLFASWMDTLLTVLSGLLIVALVSSFIGWVVGQANWFIINFNLRLLMVGRFPPEALWRVSLLAIITFFAIGLAFAAWSRISRAAVVAVVILLAVLFILPPVVYSLVPVSPSYVTAGNVELTSGAASQMPQQQLGFVAKAGETVTIRMADQFSADDQSLQTLSGFSDNASTLLANAAQNRLNTAQQIADIEAQLASDLLTQGQRQRLTVQRDRLEVPPPITETYAINQNEITVRILQGSALEPVAEGVLSADSPAFSVVLPEDGWYVLDKAIPEGDPVVAVLETTGIGPILERQFTRAGGEVDEASGETSSVGGRISEYVRMTDGFTTRALRPKIEGRDVPMSIIIDNRYRGETRPSDYLRLFVAPFFEQVSVPLAALFAALGLGYLAGKGLDRVFTNPIKPRFASRRTATWLMILLPVLMFALVYGVGNILPLTDTRRWGGLLLTIMLTVVGIVASFPIGIALALGRRSHLPAISTFCTIYIEFVRGVPLITVLFMGQLLLPLVNPSLAEMPNAFRAMVAITLFSAAYLAENVRGGLQSIPPGQEEAAKALGLSNWQVTIYITLPQALRAVLPALVGQVISLFKDTSLVAIVGLLDLTGMAQNIVAQTEFIGLRREVLLFITIIYFGISFAIAAVARRIEESGAGAAQTRKI